MQNFILWLLIVTAVLLIIVILLQKKSSGLGSAIAGGGENIYSSSRGLDRILTWLTVALAAIFFSGALAYLFV